MTKKDFEAMASFIRAHDESDTRTRAYVRGMVTLAIFIGRRSNPRFDEKRFLEACGLNKT